MANEIKASKGRLWTGRVIGWLVAAFLIFDGVTKVMQIEMVRQAFAQLGYAEFLAPRLGVVLLVCVALYLIPRTAVLGAILMTGLLGGATITTLRIGDPSFPMPVILGMMAWGGLYLRDERIRTLIPLRRG